MRMLRHQVRTICHMMLTVALISVAILISGNMANADVVAIPELSFVPDTKVPGLAEALNPALTYVPYRASYQAQRRSGYWFKAALPPRGFDLHYLDLNTNFSGHVPGGTCHVYIVGDDDPRTVLKLRPIANALYRLPATPTSGSIYVHTSGMPGITFAMLIHSGAASGLDFNGIPWLTAFFCTIACLILLRGLLEHAEWRILAALFTLSSGLLVWFDAPRLIDGIPAGTSALPALLIPGIILFLIPHIIRTSLGLRERGGLLDKAFIAASFLCIPAFIPVFPPFNGFIHILGLWFILLMPYPALCAAAVFMNIPGSGKHLLLALLVNAAQCAILVPFATADLISAALGSPLAYAIVKSIPLLSLCLASLLLLFFSFPQIVSDIGEKPEDRPEQPTDTTAAETTKNTADDNASKEEPPSLFNLHPLIMSVINTVQDAADDRNLSLAWHIAPQISRRYHGNQAALANALLQLLVTSINATKHGQIQLRAKRLPESNDPGQLLFSVTDTGVPTIPDRDMTALADVWKLVASMNGALSMTSDPTGTTVSFAIRLRPEKSDVPSENLPSADNFQTTLSGALRILIVSSIPSNREMLAYYLDELHYDMREARSTAEALTMYAQTPGALIIFNTDLPEQEIIRAIAQIRALETDNDYPMTSVLVLVDSEQQAERMRRAGCTRTLTSPVTLTLLRHTVLKLAPHPQSTRPKLGGDTPPKKRKRSGVTMTRQKVGTVSALQEHRSPETGISRSMPLSLFDIPSPGMSSVEETPSVPQTVDMTPPAPKPETQPAESPATHDEPLQFLRPPTLQLPSNVGKPMPISRTAISELAVIRAASAANSLGTASHAVQEAKDAARKNVRIAVAPRYVPPVAVPAPEVQHTDEPVPTRQSLLARLFGRKEKPMPLLPQPIQTEWVGEPTPIVKSGVATEAPPAKLGQTDPSDNQVRQDTEIGADSADLMPHKDE